MGIRRKTKLRISYDCFSYCGFGEIWLCFQNSSDCFNPGKHKLIHVSLETTCFFRFDFPHIVISHTYIHFDAFEIENKRIKLSFSLSQLLTIQLHRAHAVCSLILICMLCFRTVSHTMECTILLSQNHTRVIFIRQTKTQQ